MIDDYAFRVAVIVLVSIIAKSLLLSNIENAQNIQGL